MCKVNEFPEVFLDLFGLLMLFLVGGSKELGFLVDHCTQEGGFRERKWRGCWTIHS